MGFWGDRRPRPKIAGRQPGDAKSVLLWPIVFLAVPSVGGKAKGKQAAYERSAPIGDALDRTETKRNCDPTPYRTFRQGQRADKERPLIWCRRIVPRAASSAPRRPLAPARHSVDGKPPASARHAIPHPTPLAPGGGLGAGGQGVPNTSQCRLEKQPTPATASPCRKTVRAPGRRPGLLAPTPAASPEAIVYVTPAKGSVETRPYLPYGAAAWVRTPRRQRRVAHPSGAATVCTENREKPQTTPFRVPLPWPP